MKASIKELRQSTKEIFDTVFRGEEVIITYRNKKLAKIVPIHQKEKKSIVEDEAFGMWEDRNDMESPLTYVRRLRKGRFHDH